MSTGSTPNGYIPKQTSDFQLGINEDHALIVDPKTGETPFQNSTDDTILQQVVGIVAEAMALTDNAVAWVSRQRDPRYATGAGLEGTAQLNGITKNRGAATIISERFIGFPATVIPVGFSAKEEGGTAYFVTREQYVIPASGSIDGYMYSVDKSPYVPEDGTVVSIQTSVPGLESIQHLGLVSKGKNEETDEELRRRQQLSTNATSYRQVEAVHAGTLDVPGVTFSRIYQNRTLSIDDRDIPGKTCAAVVVGGDDWEIANAIWKRVPMGMNYIGNVVVDIPDKNNEIEVVQFTRPEPITIWVRITMRIDTSQNIQEFPADGPQQIAENIVDFSINGKLPCNTNGNRGFPPGQEIVRSYLGDPINRVPGVDVQKVELSTDGVNFSMSNVAIAWNEWGLFAEERIEVIINP